MAFWMVGLVVVVAVVGWAMHLLKQESVGRERVEAELHDTRTPTLEYVLPTGEDPVVVVAALERAGFTVGVDSHGSHQVVMVKCPEGVDRCRPKVRGIIETAGAPAPRAEAHTHADVRFRDE